MAEELELFEGCPWLYPGSYPDTPPELCDLDPDPGSEEGYCLRHEQAVRGMEEWEKRHPPEVETV